MNSFVKNLLAFLVIFTFAIALSCGDDEPNGNQNNDNRSDQEIATDSLTNRAWTLANGGSVEFDGTNVTDEYTGLTATFSEVAGSANTYSTTNAGNLFDASGTWEWQDATTATILELNDSDKSALTVLELDDNIFRFRFTQISDATGGQAAGTEGLAGNYTITLTR